MEGFLEIALSFPTILYTLLLTLVVVYWLFVIVGALDFDLLDSVFEGVGESIGEGAFEGASEAIGEGASEAIGEGIGDGLAEGAGEGAVSGALSVVGALGLNKVPVTISLSLIILFSWPLTYFGARFLRGLPYGGVLEIALAAGVLLVSTVLGVLLASVAARPMAGAFAYHSQSAGALIVGQTVTIKSTRVDGNIGQGEFNDGGAGLLINVRCHAENDLKKGRSALIVGYDPVTELYEVAPLTDDSGPQRGHVIAQQSTSQTTQR